MPNLDFAEDFTNIQNLSQHPKSATLASAQRVRVRRIELLGILYALKDELKPKEKNAIAQTRTRKMVLSHTALIAPQPTKCLNP